MAVSKPKVRTTAKQKDIIFRMYEYFKKDDVNANFGKLTTLATGASRGTVYRAVAEGRAKNSKPGTSQNKANKRNQAFNVGTFDIARLRRIIYTFYIVGKVAPSLNELSAALKENGVWNGSTETLQRVLLTIGYTYTTRKLIRPVLVERNDMLEKRFDYLRIILRSRTQNRNIFFVGETCFEPVQYADVWGGDQINVIIAGSRNGLLKPYIYPSALHENITETEFLNWVEQKLKNQLPTNSVVVMGSEHYHCTQTSKQPTSESLKQEMKKWLRQHNVYFAPDMSKVELFKMIKSIPVKIAYKVDEILEGHTVLHVPRFHPDLNPMSSVFNEVKEDFFREIVLTFDEKSDVLNKLFSQYPKDKFEEHNNKVCLHEKEYWRYDMRMDAAMDQVILSLRKKLSGDERDDSESEAEDIEEPFDRNYCDD